MYGRGRSATLACARAMRLGPGPSGVDSATPPSADPAAAAPTRSCGPPAPKHTDAPRTRTGCESELHAHASTRTQRHRGTRAQGRITTYATCTAWVGPHSWCAGPHVRGQRRRGAAAGVHNKQSDVVADGAPQPPQEWPRVPVFTRTPHCNVPCGRAGEADLQLCGVLLQVLHLLLQRLVVVQGTVQAPRQLHLKLAVQAPGWANSRPCKQEIARAKRARPWQGPE